MRCIDTQAYGSLPHDIGSGSESHLIQRTKSSNSVFPSDFKYHYSRIKAKDNPNNDIPTPTYEAGQINSSLSQQTFCSDGFITHGMFDFTLAEPAQDNSPLNFTSKTWDFNDSYTNSIEMARIPPRESTAHSLSNSVCSNDYFHMLSENFNDKSKSNSNKCQDITVPMKPQNSENFHYHEENSICQKYSLSNSDSHLTSGSHGLSNIAMDDDILAMNFGINVSSDPISYIPTSTSNHSLWDDVSSASSPEILPRYEEWNISPMMSNSICFSSSTQVPSRNIEKYSVTAEQPDQSLVDNMDKMAVGSRSPFGSNELITTSNQPFFVGFKLSDDTPKPLRRSGIESETSAREHPLYQNAIPQEDGLYHCPWENKPGFNCQHKPEKLKCNYDKCVDSHLKPYHCKITACNGLSFSSTACLLRHEREAHAMHGHGDKPFMCEYEGCERGLRGKGFPRHWNLLDHIRRVHKDPPSSPLQNLVNPESSTESSASGASKIISATSCTNRRRRVKKDSIKAFSKGTHTSSITRKPKKSMLIERYKQNHQVLLETVKQLQDPKQLDNMTLFRNANECLEVMVQTTKIINSVPSVAIKVDENESPHYVR